MTGFLVIVFMLLLIIVMLIALAVFQIKMAGMNVKDFWTFIKANETLNKLYAFSKKYEKLTTNEQLVFLREAERVFDAFDKVPNVLWEEDYQKYMEVLSKYKDIRLVRWEKS
jgi:biopolymer transport protein ExbB/TolQ